MASRSLFAVLYLDDEEKEQVMEVPAYSTEQAWLLAREFCSSNEILSVDCTSRHYQMGFAGALG